MAGAAITNADNVVFALEHLVEGFDFEIKGATGSGLGIELLDLISNGIRDRTIGEGRQPDGIEFDPNADAYEKKKGGLPVGVLTGQMTSEIEMKGERVISNEEVTMVYGVSTDAKRKAQWFTRGSEENEPKDIEHSGAKDQPPRPFWGLDDAIQQALTEHVQEVLEKHIEQARRNP